MRKVNKISNEINNYRNDYLNKTVNSSNVNYNYIIATVAKYISYCRTIYVRKS